MDFLDRVLKCADCGEDFVFTAGEQLFFFDKQFKNDPKRCKPCKGKRAGIVSRPGASGVATIQARTETRTECSACGVETTVPFKPTQGRPVLCRQCFQGRQVPAAVRPSLSGKRADAIVQMNAATASLVAAASVTEHANVAPAMELPTLPSTA